MLVTAQTAWNLQRLAEMAGRPGDLGKVVDKLVRDRMVLLKGGREHGA